MELLNFHQVTSNIGTSGHPKPADFEMIAAQGYQVIVNLAMHDADDAIAEEGSLVSKAGMSYCLLYTSPSPRDLSTSRMPSSA